MVKSTIPPGVWEIEGINCLHVHLDCMYDLSCVYDKDNHEPHTYWYNNYDSHAHFGAVSKIFIPYDIQSKPDYGTDFPVNLLCHSLLWER